MRTMLTTLALALALSACGKDNTTTPTDDTGDREAPEVVTLHGEAACSDYPEMPAEVQPWHCCNDGINNDGDLWTDTDDEDCRDYNMENPPEDLEYETGFCNDNTDNDGDGDIDCDDQDCMTDPACTVPEDEEDDTNDNNTNEDDTEAETKYYFAFEDCDSTEYVEVLIETDLGGTWYTVEENLDLCGESVTLTLDHYDGVTDAWVEASSWSVYSDDESDFMACANAEWGEIPESDAGCVYVDGFSVTEEEVFVTYLELLAQ